MKNHLLYRRYIYIAIIVIALGVTLSTTLSESNGTLGMVFIALGALLFIIGINKKRSFNRKA